MTSYRVYLIERLPVLLGRLDAGRRLDGSLQQARPHAQARDLLLFDELRQVVGKLIYAMTACQLDVSIAACKLAQHTQAPTKVHY